MKRLVIATIAIVILLMFLAYGCAEKETVTEKEVVSSCVACHTDKDTLKEVATPEPEEAKSEATSGEG